MITSNGDSIVFHMFVSTLSNFLLAQLLVMIIFLQIDYPNTSKKIKILINCIKRKISNLFYEFISKYYVAIKAHASVCNLISNNVMNSF